MKILFASEVSREKNAGTAGGLLSLTCAFKKLGHDIELLFGDDFRWIPPGRFKGILFGLELFFLLLIKRCNGIRYDIIVISGANAYMAGLMRFFGCGRSIVGRSHGAPRSGYSVDKSMSFKHNVVQFVYSLQCEVGHYFIDLLLVPSSSHIKQLPLKLAKRARIVPYGLDDEYHATVKERSNKTDEVRVLYVGNWLETKGVNCLVTAIKKLTLKKKNIFFTIVGAKDTQFVKANFTGLSNRVVVHPVIGRKKLITIYDTHDVFLFPSLSEGYGRVIIEAMGRELCVVTTSVGIVPDIIQNGINGLIIEKNSTESIITVLTQLLEHPLKIKEIARRGRSTVKKLTWQNAAEESLLIYREALAIAVQR